MALARNRTVVAWAGDLVADPALMRLWAAAVGPRDGARLSVLVRPGDDAVAVARTAAEAGLGEGDAAGLSVVEVEDDFAGAQVAAGAAAVLSPRPEAHAYGPPVVSAAAAPQMLRASIGLPPRTAAVAPATARRAAGVDALVDSGDVDRMLALVARLLREGATDTAADVAVAVAKLAPGRADVLRALADVRLAQERHAEAAALYRQALDGAASAHEDLQARRISELQALWDCPRLEGMPRLLQPAMFLGPGRVTIGDDVIFGWPRSPGFHTGSIYVEAGRPTSEVTIGDGTLFNNDAVIRSEGPGITVGRNGLFGTRVEIFDSDFHHVDRALRRSGTHPTAAVEIGDDVWVGANAIILKGVTIGDAAVVGAASVVTSDVPAGVVVAGNPARIVREL